MITYGNREDDKIPVANNAVFFLVTLVSTGKSIVLGYFLIKSLNTEEKSRLILDAIDEINATGSFLLSMAFDGLKTNFSTCAALGASFDIENIRPYIINKANGRKIYIVLDPPHMLKCVRNCLSAKSPLKDGDNNVIHWNFFRKTCIERIKFSFTSHDKKTHFFSF